MQIENTNSFTEKIEFKFGGFSLNGYIYGNRNFHIWPNNFFKISRNATDDSFNIYIDNEMKDEYGNIINNKYLLSPFVSVNNKVQINHNNNQFIVDQLKKKDKALIHSSYLKKMPFSKLSSLAIGSDSFWYFGRWLRHLRLSLISLFPNKISQNKNLISINKQKIIMKYLDSIDAKIKKTQKINVNFDPSTGGASLYYNRKPLSNDDLIIRKSFNTIYFVPSTINRLTGNKVIATILSSNIGKNGIDYSDIDIKTGLYKTPFGKFKTQFIPSKKNTFSKDGIPIIGHIVINDFSYYDYKSQKIKYGWSKNSVIGELIPYNFKGKYIATLDISFNKILSDMKITVIHDLKNKILDPINGQIKLLYQKGSRKIKKYRYQIDVKNMKYIISLKNIEKINIISKDYEKKKSKNKIRD